MACSGKRFVSSTRNTKSFSQAHGEHALEDVIRRCLKCDTAKRLTMKQLKMHSFLQDYALLDMTDLLGQVKSRVYNLQLVDRVCRVPISHHKVLEELNNV